MDMLLMGNEYLSINAVMNDSNDDFTLIRR